MAELKRGGRSSWSVFDGVKSFPPASASAPNPETLMAEIDAAIASREHSRASAHLRRCVSSSPAHQRDKQPRSPADIAAVGSHSAGLADEAFKEARAALAEGRPDEALRFLRVALASCPPDKASALSKIRALIAFATSQQHQQLPFGQQKPRPS